MPGRVGFIMGKPVASFTNIGGQAVIEGVMMRSPHFITVAVRRSNHRIVLRNRPYQSIGLHYPLLKKPILRGIGALIESMIQGMSALNFSAEVAAGESEAVATPPSRWGLAGVLICALSVGLGLFVALPHFLTVLFTSNPVFGWSAENPLFHLTDGLFKMLILLGYVSLISCMKDIYCVFQYHGAEHKSIYAFEAGEDLTVENARKYTTLHPRCGTSFLVFLVVISALIFSFIFPFFGLSHFSSHPVLNHGIMLLLKLFLMLPVAGLAYEFIKACAFRMDHSFFRLLIWPGMVLQRLTTREPSDEQLEVALASLKQVLRLEQEQKTPPFLAGEDLPEVEISQLSELGFVHARVGEYLEV